MIKVDNANDLCEELKKNERVLALFYASWCPYCMGFVPAFNKEVSKFSKGVVVHVLLDDYNNPLWDDYDIEAVPTVVLFEKENVSARLDGKFGVGLKGKQLEEWMEKSGLV